MPNMKIAAALGLLASAAVFAGPAFAEMGKPSEGDGTTPRGASIESFSSDVKPIAVPKLEEGQNRAAPMDPNKAADGLGVLTRSADGKETKTAPDPKVRELFIKEFTSPPAQKPQSGATTENPLDPAFGSDRQVFGDDDRVRVANTKSFPFRAIGFIQATNEKGDLGSCSGTLVGPRTVLTAAHCVYSHDGGGWLKDVLFAPGLNGMEDAPFGVYAAESTSVLEGFVTNYQGFYGSVVPWDLGVITLKDPIGDKLGYFGYANIDDLGDFDANIVGYPGDKPAGTMWRATCAVMSEAIGLDYFQYDCDTYPGSSGSSVYAYDNSSKTRIVTGVNVAESKDANTAVRLNAAYVGWLNGLWK